MMTHNPMVTNWQIYFDKSDGYDNRAIVAKAFADFYGDPKADKLEIPGKCMLGGKVFGREGINNGAEVLTSNLKFIERVERTIVDDIPHDLMCATTFSGSKYFFYSDDSNAFMFLMLGDLIYRGKLNSRPYYYLKPKLHGGRLI